MLLMEDALFDRKNADKVDTEGDVLFGIGDTVSSLNGGPCMVITELVGKDKAALHWFSESGVPFTKVLPLAVLEHWEDE